MGGGAAVAGADDWLGCADGERDSMGECVMRRLLRRVRMAVALVRDRGLRYDWPRAWRAAGRLL